MGGLCHDVASLGCALLLAATPALAQVPSQPAKPPAVQQGKVNLPALPKLKADSPRSSMLFADRLEVRPAAKDFPKSAAAGSASTPVLVNYTLPASSTGTGMAEPIQYQLPTSYAPHGTPIPLLMAWHGFGNSAGSVALQTTLDEHCESKGWAFLSVTGIDDKLFGPPVSQQNAEAALRFMLEQFRIDPERIYLVGFSMGAGVVANFAARHRDPDDLMIAAIGCVSGSFDWTMTWLLEPAIQTWMNSSWNFGGPPGLSLFPYQRSSALFHDPLSYPPLPGLHLDLGAMARNLHATPTYLSWDTGDTITYLPPQSLVMAGLLTAAGGVVQTRTVSGTLNPLTGQPATHSWAVLDEAELFAFLEPHSAQRHPASFLGQLDGPAAVSWARVEPRQAGAFSWIVGEADVAGGQIDILDIENALEVQVALDQAGFGAATSLRLRSTSADHDGYRLRLTNGDRPVGALLHATTGAVLPGFDIAPADGALLVTVPAQGVVDAIALIQPWQAELSLLPDPAAPGSPVELALQAPPGTPMAWLIVALTPGLTPFASGNLLFIELTPPLLFIPVPLDPHGAAHWNLTLPQEPALSGLTLWNQALLVGPGPGVSGLSNVFPFDIN
ncbi:MAG: hypothetical protein ACT4PU_10540 [Planctomycetota bacterium]